MALDELSDEALVAAAWAGDRDALLQLFERYRPVLRALAKRYFLPGGDVDDLLQEASLGLAKAVRDYRPELGIPFRPFAELCVTRQVITAVKTATRQKHIPLNTAISLQRPRFDEEDSPELGDALADKRVPSPEEQADSVERYREIIRWIKEVLSPYERKVIRCYMEGMSYQEIAAACGTHVKSVDNALWRVKCKLRRAMGDMLD